MSDLHEYEEAERIAARLEAMNHLLPTSDHRVIRNRRDFSLGMLCGFCMGVMLALAACPIIEWVAS